MADSKALDDKAFDTLFREARTYNGWLDQDVPDSLLKEVYELAKWGPTSANCCPMRVVFVRTPEAKERLKPFLGKGNIDKTMAAPVTAIIGDDKKFYEELPTLFPHADAKSWFIGKPGLVEETAFRNGTLQGAYFMMAARAMGLDCGPMSGFDSEAVTDEFFKGTEIEANFLCNLGFGDPESLHMRGPRMRFEEVCKVV